MTSCTKIKYPTERAALDALKKLRRTHGGKDLRSLKAYRCSDCGGFHIGHSFKTSRIEFPKISPGEWKKLKRRVEDVGRMLAKDEDRRLRKKFDELSRIVAEDAIRLREEADRAEFAAAILEHIRRNF